MPEDGEGVGVGLGQGGRAGGRFGPGGGATSECQPARLTDPDMYNYTVDTSGHYSVVDLLQRYNNSEVLIKREPLGLQELDVLYRKKSLE